MTDQVRCTHPTITVEDVERAERIAARDRFADATYRVCPDCDWDGYPTIDETGQIIFNVEPEGAGR